MDGPRVFYAKCNKSDRGGKIPYGFTYMGNLKKKTKKNKQKKTKTDSQKQRPKA